MPFKRAKPKVIIAHDDDDDEADDKSVVDVPVIPIKKSGKSLNGKRKKLNISFDEQIDEDGDSLGEPKIKIKEPKVNFKIPSRSRIVLPSPNVSDAMDLDVEEESESTVYSDNYIQQLKSQNMIQQKVPRNTAYKVIDTNSNENHTVIPDELTLREMKQRETRGDYQELQQDAEDFIALEDYDEEFQHLSKMNKGNKDIDKHVDFEIDLHEDFADNRLPLTEREANLAKEKSKNEIQNALDYLSDDDLDPSATPGVSLKNLGTVEDQMANLEAQIEEFNDVKAIKQEDLDRITQERLIVQDKKILLIEKINELALKYSQI